MTTCPKKLLSFLTGDEEEKKIFIESIIESKTKATYLSGGFLILRISELYVRLFQLHQYAVFFTAGFMVGL